VGIWILGIATCSLSATGLIGAAVAAEIPREIVTVVAVTGIRWESGISAATRRVWTTDVTSLSSISHGRLTEIRLLVRVRIRSVVAACVRIRTAAESPGRAGRKAVAANISRIACRSRRRVFRIV
jgi:hypothetical protein